MDVLELLYIAMGAIGVLIFLHLGTFWVSRVMQPPKPKIVYVQAPPQQQQQAPPPPPPPPILKEATLPTYDIPPPRPADPPAETPSKLGVLPPPIETRNSVKQSNGDMGAPR